VIQALDRADFESLRELGFRVEAAPSPDGAAVAVSGEPPAAEEPSVPAPEKT